MNPEWWTYLREGEWIIIGAIISLVLIFFKYRIPHVQKKLNNKVNGIDCIDNRDKCNQLFALKLDVIRDHFNLEVRGLNDKIDTVILNQKEMREKIDRLFEVGWKKKDE